MRDQLARLPVDHAIDQNVRAGFVIIPVVARGVLEIPVHLAGVGIPGDHAVGVEVVARTIGGVEHGNRIAGAPDHLVGGGVVGACHPHRPAAGLPGDLGLVLPGLAAGLAGRRDHVFAPDHLAGRAVERRDEVAHAAVAPGGADDDLVLDHERRGGELQISGCPSDRFVSHTTLPLSLLVAMMRGG